MRGHAAPITPATSDGLNVFHGVLMPVRISRRETGHEVSPRRPTNNASPSLAQRSGRAFAVRRQRTRAEAKSFGGYGARRSTVETHNIDSRSVAGFVAIK